MWQFGNSRLQMRFAAPIPMGQEDVPIAFFSYCREDSEFALKLAADLKVAGAHVWIDQLDIEPGTPWDRAVEEALTHSPRMLVVLSPVSVNSDNVRDEVSFALSRQKRVIPVLYRDCEVPFRLARLQHIDFRPDYARALTILVRALGVGQAAPSHPPMAAAATAADSAVSHTEAEAEEKARQQKLAEDRLLAEQQRQLEEARKYAAEQSRLKKERGAAAEQAVHEQEQQQSESEVRARQEQLRREQRAAEQARLEEEARLAAERVRLAQEEKERREAEIKARQEQLRREQQESVERAQLDLGRLEQEDRERKAAEKKAQQEKLDEERRLAAEQERAERARRVAAIPASPEQQQKEQPAPRKIVETSAVAGAAAKRPEIPVAPRPGYGASPAIPRTTIYVAGTTILLLVIGIIVYSFSRGDRGASRPPKQDETASVAQTPQIQAPQTQAPQTQAPTGPQSSAATPAAGGASAQPASVGETDQTKNQKPPVERAPSPAGPNDAQGKKAAPAPNLVMKIGADNAVTLSPAAPDKASASDRVRISQGVSQGWLVHEVKPDYPPLARQTRVQGQVVLNVVISKTGAIKSIAAQTGHPLLIPAAIDAVKQWRYQPHKVDGKPVEVDTQVFVNFTLTN